MNIDRLLSDDVGRRSAFHRYVKEEAPVVWSSWLDSTNLVSLGPVEWSSRSATASVDPRRTAHSTPLRNARRRPRTTFSTEQTDCLEREYGKNEYISRSKRMRIADQLRLNEGQIKIWFQNRRAKDKRIQKAHSKLRSYHLSCLSHSPTVSIIHPDQNRDTPLDHSDDEKFLPPGDRYTRSNIEEAQSDSPDSQ